MRSLPFSRNAKATATRVFLDDLVGDLAPNSPSDRSHEHLGRGKEGQVAIEFALHDCGIRAEVIEHRQERLEETVGREKRPGQRHSPHDRARHVALVPLVAGKLAGHAREAP